MQKKLHHPYLIRYPECVAPIQIIFFQFFKSQLDIPNIQTNGPFRNFLSKIFYSLDSCQRILDTSVLYSSHVSHHYNFCGLIFHQILICFEPIFKLLSRQQLFQHCRLFYIVNSIPYLFGFNSLIINPEQYYSFVFRHRGSW